MAGPRKFYDEDQSVALFYQIYTIAVDEKKQNEKVRHSEYKNGREHLYYSIPSLRMQCLIF